eukprot:gene31210-37718_t
MALAILAPCIFAQTRVNTANSGVSPAASRTLTASTSTAVSTVVSKVFAVYSSEAPAAGAVGIALVMGVGTNMAKEDYSDIATALVQALPDFFVVIMDSNPGGFKKTDSTMFANALTTVDQWFTQQRVGVQGWLLGGHSASGEACVEAVNKGLVKVTGRVLAFVGFDPFKWQANAQNLYDLKLPSLIFAKTKKDCVSDLANSGTGFHIHATSPAGSSAAHNLLTFTDDTEHCVFANNGCNFVFTQSCGFSGSGVSHADAMQNIAAGIKAFVDAGFSQLKQSPVANAKLSAFTSPNGKPEL